VERNALLVLIRAERPDDLDGWHKAFGSRIEIELLALLLWATLIRPGGALEVRE
jgi:hypothetical protein